MIFDVIVVMTESIDHLCACVSRPGRGEVEGGEEDEIEEEGEMWW